MKDAFALHGAVAFSGSQERIETFEDAYVVCEDGISMGVFRDLPKKYGHIPVEELDGMLITPGFVDLHTHAPQYNFRGQDMDMELIDWLNRCSYPEEEKYADPLYAERSYDLFAEELYEGPTSRACVFATRDVPSTIRLMEMMEEAGLVSYVGKVCMDRNVPEGCLEDTDRALEETEEWIAQTQDRFENTYPILTPRFVPACSRKLLAGLGKLSEKYHVPVQSHLSENPKETEWVKKLEPQASFYGDVYERCGLFGTPMPAVMAHCVYSSEEEIRLMKKNGVFVAHCPDSNMNLSSGIAPIRRYLQEGIPTGLGSDVAAGSSTSIMKAAVEAIQLSKMRWRIQDQTRKPLTFEEAFYMATKGGGAFFGKAGSLEEGYEFDAVVFDDSNLATMTETDTKGRLERMLYCGDDRNVCSKYIRGRKIY